MNPRRERTVLNDLPILLTPVVAGALVLLTHVPLGKQVLRRGIVFIDLAIAQVAALGVLVAGSTIESTGLSRVAGAGAVAALAGAALVAWLGRRWPARREALIGLVYVAAAAAALLWVSADPHGGQKLSTMLSGDVLWVTWRQMLPLAAATLLFLALQAWKPALWARSGAFYPCFAILVSLSVPLLGLYLVFATLIVPALTMLGGRTQPGRGDGWGAIALGVFAYLAGLLASLWLDLPSGPCIVLALMLVGVAAAAARRAAGRRRCRTQRGFSFSRPRVPPADSVR